MIDCHSHVLAQMDDGSQSVEESLELLRRSAAQGVTIVAATPHFYADREAPDRFLARRQQSLKMLKSVWNPVLPLLVCGAEVQYYSGLFQTESLRDLAIGNTGVLLVEMPFAAWSGQMIRDITLVQEHLGLQVVLAHIERYFHFSGVAALLPTLIERSILIQSNASAFLSWRTQRRVTHMLNNGQIHLLGSDCHNLTSRPPMLGDAELVIRHKCGPDIVDAIEQRGKQLFASCMEESL